MNRFHVLQVDDDPLVLKLVASVLGNDAALTLTSCTTGEQALAIVAERAPDLILCDVVMPGMSGPDLLARLRAMPHMALVPVIFITARAQPADVADLISQGAAAVISKPFKLRALARTIHDHLAVHTVDVVDDKIQLAPDDYDIAERLRSDAAILETFRHRLTAEPASADASEGLRICAHNLAGAAGIYDFAPVSEAASAVEQAVVDRQAGAGDADAIRTTLNNLLTSIERTR